MILVTGATGYVGSHVIRRAAARSLPVRGLVRRPVSLADAESAVGDVTDPASLAAALKDVDTVIHAAAITANHKEPYRGAYDRVNRQGTENLVDAARSAGTRRIVLLSGLGTVPAPPGTYMATRWGMEEAVRGSGLEQVILQPSVLFGAGSEFVDALARLVRRSPVVPVIGPPTVHLQPLWIEDLVTCLLQAVSEPALAGRVLPLGGPERLTFREVIGVICRALGKRRLLAPLPLPIARVQSRLLSAVLPNPPLTPAAVELFSFDNATDQDALKQAFGFEPEAFSSYLLAHGVDG